MTDSLLPADAALPDTFADAPADGASVVPVSTLLGTRETVTSGGSVAIDLTTNVPAGTLLVVEVAARGDPPITLTDSKQHTWTTAVETGNASGTSVAGIYYVVLTSPLGVGNSITATVTGSNANTKALAVYKLDNVSSLDQIGSGKPSTTTAPSVTTTAAVTTSTELAFGAIVTGFNSPDSFVPGQGFTEDLEFGTPLSSGSFNHKLLVAPTGVQTFSVTAQQSAAYAMVIATFR